MGKNIGRKFLKRILPVTLFGRSLMILITPVVMVQAVTTWVFFDRHWSKVTELLARNMAGNIGMCADLYTKNPNPKITPEDLKTLTTRHFDMDFTFYKKQTLDCVDQQSDPAWQEEILRPMLQQHLAIPFNLEINERKIQVYAETPKGLLLFQAPTKNLFTRTTAIFVWWIVLAPGLFLLVAILFLRNQVRPLRELSEIVDSFGKGRSVPSIRPRGAREVRMVARAFNLMKERIQKQMTQHGEMLSGISHDLKTPLTRMELALAMMPQNETTTDLLGDVREMAQMIEEYLSFARGEEGEKATSTDITDLLRDLQQRLDPSRIHLHTIPVSLVLLLRRSGMKRCLANILINALRYAGNAYISMKTGPRKIQIIIEDDGPGIPEDAREDVFRPFFRLENSRNTDTGGTGLGLAIARTIIHQHGGEIILYSSQKYGGLKVVLNLPI